MRGDKNLSEDSIDWRWMFFGDWSDWNGGGDGNVMAEFELDIGDEMWLKFLEIVEEDIGWNCEEGGIFLNILFFVICEVYEDNRYWVSSLIIEIWDDYMWLYAFLKFDVSSMAKEIISRGNFWKS